MANTLVYSNLEELKVAIKSYNSYISDIPTEFPVLDEYLFGITKTDFCKAFKDLEKFVLTMYENIYEDPELVGLTIKNKNGEMVISTTQNISCIKKVLYTIGLCSTLQSNTLILDNKAFANYYYTFYSNISIELKEPKSDIAQDKLDKFFKIKINPVIKFLEQFGFNFDGFDENLLYSQMRNFKISFNKNTNLLTVIKAFSMPRICFLSFGIDYTKFNYRVFGYTANAMLPLNNLYSFCLLNDEQREFFMLLNEKMNALGISFGECESGWYNGTLPCQYNYKNKLRILQNIESGIMPHLVIDYRKQNKKITDLIESMPEIYRNNLPKCRGCKKECGSRYFWEIGCKKTALCHGGWWFFPPVKESVEFIVKVFEK